MIKGLSAKRLRNRYKDDPLQAVEDGIDAADALTGNSLPEMPSTDHLVPLGDTGLWVTPNEPVSPNDCARWPNSPMCGGTGFSAPDRGIVGTGVSVSVSITNCEQCVTVEPSLTYVSLPPYTVCYRFENCPREEGRYEDPTLPTDTPQTFAADAPYPTANPWEYSQPGYCRVYLAKHFDITKRLFCGGDFNLQVRSEQLSSVFARGLSPNFGKTIRMEAMSCFGDYYSGRQVTYPFESNGYSAFSGVIYSAIFRELADWDSKRITGWRDPEWKEFRPFPEKGWGTAVRVSGSFQCMDCGPGRQGQGVFAAAESQTDLVWIDIRKDSTYAPYLESEAAFQAFYEQERGKGQNKDPLFVGFPSGDYGCFKIICNTYPHQEPLPAPAYPPPEKPPMSCNCSEIEELLRGIYLRLGVDQYPVTVPESLTQKGNKTQELPDLTALAGWLTVQMDALMGQFPIEIEIEDDDLLKEGNQRRKVELPNLAETISELYALAYQSSVAGEIQINFLTRLTAELIATKNAAIITQDYARANASYLGYKGNPKRRKIRYAIDIEKSDKFTSLFNEVTKEVIGWEEDDPQTVAEYLQKLMYAAGIIKAAFMRKGNQAGGVIDGLRELFKGTNFDDGWQNFIEDLKNPDSIYNTGAIPKPDIVDTSPDALADILAELKKRNGTNNQP